MNEENNLHKKISVFQVQGSFLPAHENEHLGDVRNLGLSMSSNHNRTSEVIFIIIENTNQFFQVSSDRWTRDIKR
jgi:hypothetical protein